MLLFLPVIVGIALLSAIVGMVAVAVAFIAVSALLQLLAELLGLLWGSSPWHIITFHQDGRFVFEMTESAYSAMNFLARWVGLVGGGAYGAFLFARRQRRKGAPFA